MTKVIRYINLFSIILLIVLVIYMLIDLIPIYLYNSETTGKEINNTEEISICKKIINKKYEIILYGRVQELNELYVDKYDHKIVGFDATDIYESILKNFHAVNIKNVYKKIGNVYIAKGIVTYIDNTDEKFTIIIKMNSDKSKAAIVYDDMFN